MVRPRTLLLSYFPKSTIITQEVVSQALRQNNGDIEVAKKFLEDLIQKEHTADIEKQLNENNNSKSGNVNHENVALTSANITSTRKETISVPIKLKEKPIDDERRPPNTVSVINNLSDRQYCCVWSVEVYEDGYRPEVARTLLASIAHHVNPILRARGWRVKRLIESASSTFIGCCTGNGRYDADAASTNIQLNLRIQPNKHCTVFRSFAQILSVMLHEITHTSIGLEDIHPPAFYDLLNEIKKEYREKLALGEVDLETDMYGCDAKVVTSTGDVKTIADAARDIVPTFMSKTIPQHRIVSADDTFRDDECGVKRKRRRRKQGISRRNNHLASSRMKQPPLRKGAKMIYIRTAEGKRLLTESATLSRRDLAARAALARFGNTVGTFTSVEQDVKSYSNEPCVENNDSSGSDGFMDSDDDDSLIQPHQDKCVCRSCDWDKLLFMPPTKVNNK